MKKFIAAVAAFLIAISPAQAQVGFGGMFPGPGTPASSGAGGIQYISGSAQNLGSNGGTPSAPISTAYVGAVAIHPLLVACILGDTSNVSAITSVTYGGNPLTFFYGTQNGGGGGRFFSYYYLLNPPSGSNLFVVSQTGGGYLIPFVAEWSGVKQTGQPDGAGAANASSGNVTSLATPITIVNNGSWAILCSNANAGSLTFSNGSGATLRTTDVFNSSGLYDSNGPLSPGSNSQTSVINTPQGLLNISLSFQPG